MPGARRGDFTDASLETSSIAFVLACHVWSNNSVRVTARNVRASTMDLTAAPLSVQVVKRRVFASAAGDELACAFARLLVWKNPVALPAVDPSAAQQAYAHYDRNWRPVRKRPQDWPASWAMAIEVLAMRGFVQPSLIVAPPVTDLEARLARLERKIAALQAELTG
ncbi:hypothetical protein [Neoroseomonas soli]|uniref:hypothetical protein n=1 Tax=Neoroseomonas soli TaxID=1081025 RepID=UPI001FECB529|nr:hypothetical protein [Neoroseomonas soli]